AQAEITAIVPVLGLEFARAVEEGPGSWHDYASTIANAETANPDRVCVFPLSIHQAASEGTELGHIFGRFQRIGAPAAAAPDEPANELRSRDLAQSIAQLVGSDRLTVFISHTKRSGSDEQGVLELIERPHPSYGRVANRWRRRTDGGEMLIAKETGLPVV